MEDLTEWQKHVLSEFKDVKSSFGQLKEELVTLKVQASIWGLIAGGLISTAIALLSALVGRA
jgi:hypothetical protein